LDRPPSFFVPLLIFLEVSHATSVSPRRKIFQKHFGFSYSFEELRMFSKVGICTAGVAIGLPIWGIAATGVCIIGVSIGVGYVIGSATAASGAAAAAVLL
jgi:hypothetical protein